MPSELGNGPDQLVMFYSDLINQNQGLDLFEEVIHQLGDLPQLVWLLSEEDPMKAFFFTEPPLISVSATPGKSPPSPGFGVPPSFRFPSALIPDPWQLPLPTSAFRRSGHVV